MEAAISCKFHCKRLAERWRGYWPGVHAADLVADVEGRLASAAAAWGLKDIEPLDGGQVALTCGATQNGRPVVLKLNPRGHPDDAQLAGEGHALAFWSATGAAAELLDQRDGGFTHLLERIQPGHTLETADLSTARNDSRRSGGWWRGSTARARRRRPSCTCGTSRRPGRPPKAARRC